MLQGLVILWHILKLLLFVCLLLNKLEGKRSEKKSNSQDCVLFWWIFVIQVVHEKSQEIGWKVSYVWNQYILRLFAILKIVLWQISSNCTCTLSLLFLHYYTLFEGAFLIGLTKLISTVWFSIGNIKVAHHHNIIVGIHSVVLILKEFCLHTSENRQMFSAFTLPT